MPTEWIAGSVIENRHWTDQLYSLRVEAPQVRYMAGQFGRLALEIDGEKVPRPYSFVTSPDDPYLEFYSITVPEGPLSTRLHDLSSGDPLWVGAQGVGFFVLDEVPSSDNLWLLSTGTGIGPYLSILGTSEPWARFKRIALVHSVRCEKELSYQDTLESYRKDHPHQFTYIPMISREEHPDTLAGRIPAAIEDGRLAERTGMNFEPDYTQVMLCGNPAMIKDTSALLKTMGMTRNRRSAPGQITTESYW